MKKIVAILCLTALLLAGCAKAPEADSAADPTQLTTEPTVEIAEQIISKEESSLTGSWEATVDRGSYCAMLYLLQSGNDSQDAQAKLELLEDVTYPLQITLDLNLDGSYSYTLHGDADQTGFNAFCESLHKALTAQGEELTAQELEQALRDLRLDKIFLQSAQETGSWEHNDQALVLSGWCTIQFTEENGMTWQAADDQELDELLPLDFAKK